MAADLTTVNVLSSGAASLRCARVVAALVLTVYVGVLLAQPVPAGLKTAVDDLGQLLAASAAAVCCAVAARRSPSGRTRWAWWLLAAGTGAWAAGQAVWSYYELLAGRAVPFPSLSDAGFLAFPLLAAAGLLVLPIGRDAAARGLRNLLDGLVTSGSLLILSWASSLGATVATGGPDRLATALAVAYPLGDVVVLTLVLLVLGRAARGQRAVLVPLAVGLAALAAADSTFLYLTSTGNYASGGLCGVGWTIGFLLVALAGLATAPRTGTATGPATGRTGQDGTAGRPPVPSWLRLALPYLPLLAAQVVVTGQLLTADRRASAFEVTLGVILVVLVLARQFVTLADNRALLRQLHAERETARHAALHDPLTALANRTLFTDRVAHALAVRSREQARTTVMFCDLDDFKTVNDSLGHAAGDTLLVAVADRLRACLRPADTIARLGGDEFAVLVETSDEPVDRLAARVVAALEPPVQLSGLHVAVTVSVGVATASGHADDGIEAPELLRRADTAMYAAKANGKATWVSYDPDTHDSAELLLPVRPAT